MYSGRSIQAVAEQLTSELKLKKDVVVPTSFMLFTPRAELLVRNSDKTERVLSMSDHAHRQVASFLDIPSAYYDRMRVQSPELLGQSVNTWMVKQQQGTRRMLRLLGTRCRAFLSDRYLPIDNYDVLSILLPSIIESGCGIVAAEVTEKRMYVKALAPKITGEIKKGDTVQAGVVISNSEVGSGRVMIDPLLYRLVCSNGLIVQDMSLRRHHVGRRIAEEDLEVNDVYSREAIASDIKTFLLKARDVVKAVLTQTVFDNVVKRAQRAAGVPVENVEEMIEDVTTKFGLNEGESNAVMRHFIAGGDTSRWGVVNALTMTAHDEKAVTDFDRAIELERFAGGMLV